MAIWDADVIADMNAVIQCIEKLRAGLSDVCYPYNGICYDTSSILRDIFFKKANYLTLDDHKNMMNIFHSAVLYGGAVLINTEKYFAAGGENEKHYGWGNEDFDRMYRWMSLGYKIFRADFPLFHLSHPRGTNSNYSSDYYKELSQGEITKLLQMKNNLLSEDQNNVHL